MWMSLKCKWNGKHIYAKTKTRFEIIAMLRICFSGAVQAFNSDVKFFLFLFTCDRKKRLVIALKAPFQEANIRVQGERLVSVFQGQNATGSEQLPVYIGVGLLKEVWR